MYYDERKECGVDYNRSAHLPPDNLEFECFQQTSPPRCLMDPTKLIYRLRCRAKRDYSLLSLKSEVSRERCYLSILESKKSRECIKKDARVRSTELDFCNKSTKVC